MTALYQAHFRYDQNTQELMDMCNDIRNWDKSLLSCLDAISFLLPDTRVSLRFVRSSSPQLIRKPTNGALRERILLGCLAPLIPSLRSYQDQGIKVEVLLVDYNCQLSGPGTLVKREVWQASLEAHNARYNTAFDAALRRFMIPRGAARTASWHSCFTKLPVMLIYV